MRDAYRSLLPNRKTIVESQGARFDETAQPDFNGEIDYIELDLQNEENLLYKDLENCNMGEENVQADEHMEYGDQNYNGDQSHDEICDEQKVIIHHESTGDHNHGTPEIYLDALTYHPDLPPTERSTAG